MGKKVHYLDHRLNKIIRRLLNLTSRFVNSSLCQKEGYCTRSGTSMNELGLLVRGSANLGTKCISIQSRNAF